MLADHLVEVARNLEPLNGEGRSAVVWALDGTPRVLYRGTHARDDLVDAATGRLAGGESTFEVDSGPGVRGKVIVCGAGDDRAAYGLFLHGAGRPHLSTTVRGLIEEAERSLGTRAERMTRGQKQKLVQFLDERGAFMMRKAVDDVADRLGVTRYTIYNYLARLGDGEGTATMEVNPTAIDRGEKRS